MAPRVAVLRSILPVLLAVSGASLATPACTAPLAAQTIAVTHARIHPVTGPAIEDGTLLVRDGRIAAVGSANDVVVPAGAQIIDASGLTLIPGLVESHSHMGFKQLWRGETTGSNNNELSGPINAAARAIDGLNASDPAFEVARAAGITTMNITPGSRSPNSGQAVVVKLRPAATVEEMAFAHGGMKFAMRILRRNEFDLTVRESRELIAQRLRAAREYLDARAENRAGAGANPPPVDLELEALGKLLTREWPVGVHAHGVGPMREAIALADTFGLRLYIHHADATLELAEELAQKGIPISFGPILPFIGRGDPSLAGPVRLNELGGLVAFHQDHPDGPQYYLRQSASLFVREGMPAADALAAITINPARILGIDEDVGSFEPGKDADFVLLDGPPLEWESKVRRVFIEGMEVWRLDNERPDLLGSAVAGDGIGGER